MSSNIGLIISLLFVAIAFLFGADLITIQAAYTSLQNTANDIAYDIMQAGYFDGYVLNNIELTYGLNSSGITLTSNVDTENGESVNGYGDTVVISLSRDISLFIISSDFTISVTRSAVLGYYGNY